jgi:hypothetical protein
MLKPLILRQSVPVYGVAEQGIEVVNSEGSGARTLPLVRKIGPHSVMLVGYRPEGVNIRFPSRCWVLPYAPCHISSHQLIAGKERDFS